MILDDHERKIQTIMHHKRLDWEKRHLIWRQAKTEWQRFGNEGIPYPEPEMFPEYIVRRNNDIRIKAEDLERIYKEIQRTTINGGDV